MSTAVITGANRGIGLGLAQRLRDQGYQVIGTTRDLSDIRELAGCARVIRLDVTDDRSVLDMAAQLTGIEIDVLINNAGWLADGYPMSLLEQTIEDAARSFDVNTPGPLRILRALADSLSADAKIVNISSRYASLENLSTIDGPGYCMSKAALNMLTRQISFDPAMEGRTLVAVSPGWVRTRMGGPDARISVDESTSGIVALISRLTADDSGRFFNYDGTTIPW